MRKRRQVRMDVWEWFQVTAAARRLGVTRSQLMREAALRTAEAVLKGPRHELESGRTFPSSTAEEMVRCE